MIQGERGQDENAERGQKGEKEKAKEKKSIQETLSELSYDSLVRVFFSAFSVLFLLPFFEEYKHIK